MRGYVGVMVFAEDSLLLVQEPDYFTGVPRWGLPSGGIEEGESPAVAAARELGEETGCIVDAANLELISTIAVEHQGQPLSTSWNFTAMTRDLTVRPGDDPAETVMDARWFTRQDARDHLSALTYRPVREPALRFLTTGERGLRWTFELIDLQATIPEFRWDEPVR